MSLLKKVGVHRALHPSILMENVVEGRSVIGKGAPATGSNPFKTRRQILVRTTKLQAVVILFDNFF